VFFFLTKASSLHHPAGSDMYNVHNHTLTLYLHHDI